jgi:hypothetical protein
LKKANQFYDKNFLAAELLISIVAAAIIFWLAISHRFDVLWYMSGNRSAIYTSLTAVLGTLLGFVITGVSVILAFSESEKLQLLKKSPYYGDIFKIFTSAAKFLALGAVTAFAGLILDRDSAPQPPIGYVMIWLLIISMLRLYRCIWVVESLAKIVTLNHQG